MLSVMIMHHSALSHAQSSDMKWDHLGINFQIYFVFKQVGGRYTYNNTVELFRCFKDKVKLDVGAFFDRE